MTSTESSVIPPLDTFSLQRYPRSGDKSLRAWSSADERLLEEVANYLDRRKQENGGDQTNINCLIVNDQFGALTTAVAAVSADFDIHFWSDSYLSQKAIELNLDSSAISKASAKALPVDYSLSNDDENKLHCQVKIDRPFDLVLIRVPKHNSLLQLQLTGIAPWINQKSVIIGAGMTKDIHNSNLKIFEALVGPTTTSLAKKKARLIYPQKQNIPLAALSYSSFDLPQTQLTICGLPGVFSREKLDAGTHLLLDYLPEFKDDSKIIDLGCGSGVIGAVAAKNQPSARLLLCDESLLAVTSAQITFARNDLQNAHFLHTDALDSVAKNEYDYVLCNPPFHQQNVQTTAIANKMFRQSAGCLKETGTLLIVANRHLPYQKQLGKYFKSVRSLSRDPKFSVWQAQSPR